MSEVAFNRDRSESTQALIDRIAELERERDEQDIALAASAQAYETALDRIAGLELEVETSRAVAEPWQAKIPQ